MPLFGLHRGANVLVIAPHPDDETLGAGGTIARLAAEGVSVHVYVLACPTGVRAKELAAACDDLGVTSHAVGPFGDMAANSHQLVELIEHAGPLSIDTLHPGLLLIPAATAHHQDHRAAHHAAFAAARPRGPERPSPRLVLGYRGPDDHWSLRPEPEPVFVDTTSSEQAKHAALASYTTQLRDEPHPRSLPCIQSADAVAGAQAGTRSAERFTPYRMAF